MTIPALTRDERRYLGKLIWRHIDGVAENVNRLMEAINRDPHAAVRVVATQEWDRANAVLHALRELVVQMEQWPVQLTVEQVMVQLRQLIDAHEMHGPRSSLPNTAR